MRRNPTVPRKDRIENNALAHVNGREIPRLNPLLRSGVLPAGESLFDDPYAKQLEGCPIQTPPAIEPTVTMVGTLRSRPAVAPDESPAKAV